MCETASDLKLTVSFQDENNLKEMLEKTEFIRILASLPNNATAIYRAVAYVDKLYKFQLDGWEISLSKPGYHSGELRLPIKN